MASTRINVAAICLPLISLIAIPAWFLIGDYNFIGAVAFLFSVQSFAVIELIFIVVILCMGHFRAALLAFSTSIGSAAIVAAVIFWPVIAEWSGRLAMK